jgi:Tol biopolymer transport system component
MTYYANSYYVINMINSDGSNPLQLVYQQGDNFAPNFFPNDNGHTYFSDFSPDGTQILYFSNIDELRYEYYHIYISNADGSNRRKLTQGPFADYFGNFQHR